MGYSRWGFSNLASAVDLDSGILDWCIKEDTSTKGIMGNIFFLIFNFSFKGIFMVGGITSQANKTSGMFVPSKNNSYCDLPPLTPHRQDHTLTGLTACGGQGEGKTCSTFNIARGVWDESHKYNFKSKI